MSDVKAGHIYITPQSKVDCLKNLTFDLVISQQSLQEMTGDQVHGYCSWILKCSNRFYTCNLDDHAQIAIQKNLAKKLPCIFKSYFGDPKWVGQPPDDCSRYGDNHLPRALYSWSSSL